MSAQRFAQNFVSDLLRTLQIKIVFYLQVPVHVYEKHILLHVYKTHVLLYVVH